MKSRRVGWNLLRTEAAGNAPWGSKDGPVLSLPYGMGESGTPCWAASQAAFLPSFPLPPLQSPDPEELPCSSENSRENLLHQAMQNSGIVLERVAGEESTLEPAPPSGSSPQSLGEGPPELPLLEVEQIETVGFCYWHDPSGEVEPGSAYHASGGCHLLMHSGLHSLM